MDSCASRGTSGVRDAVFRRPDTTRTKRRRKAKAESDASSRPEKRMRLRHKIPLHPGSLSWIGWRIGEVSPFTLFAPFALFARAAFGRTWSGEHRSSRLPLLSKFGRNPMSRSGEACGPRLPLPCEAVVLGFVICSSLRLAVRSFGEGWSTVSGLVLGL